MIYPKIMSQNNEIFEYLYSGYKFSHDIDDSHKLMQILKKFYRKNANF